MQSIGDHLVWNFSFVCVYIDDITEVLGKFVMLNWEFLLKRFVCFELSRTLSL